MKGRIDGSTHFEISTTPNGLIKVSDPTGNKTLLFTPAQAKALAEFIKDAEPEMEKIYVGASWGI